MVYLPTCPIKNQPNVGEYTTHGSLGYEMYEFVFPKIVVLVKMGQSRNFQ